MFANKMSEVIRFLGKTKIDANKLMLLHRRIVHKITIKVKLKWFDQLESELNALIGKSLAKLMHSKLFQVNRDFVLHCLFSNLRTIDFDATEAVLNDLIRCNKMEFEN